MRIAAVSDTHGRRGWAVPPCDVFLHAGDMTASGTLGETAVFAQELCEAMARPAPRHPRARQP